MKMNREVYVYILVHTMVYMKCTYTGSSGTQLPEGQENAVVTFF